MFHYNNNHRARDFNLESITNNRRYNMNNINYIIINGERHNSVISAIYEIESLYEKAETIRDAWITVDIVTNDHTVTKSDYMDNMISYLNSLI